VAITTLKTRVTFNSCHTEEIKKVFYYHFFMPNITESKNSFTILEYLPETIMKHILDSLLELGIPITLVGKDPKRPDSIISLRFDEYGLYHITDSYEKWNNQKINSQMYLTRKLIGAL